MVIYIGAVHLDPGLLKTGSFLAFTITFANLMAAVLAVGYTSIGLLDLLPMFERIKPILRRTARVCRGASSSRSGSPALWP